MIIDITNFVLIGLIVLSYEIRLYWLFSKFLDLEKQVGINNK